MSAPGNVDGSDEEDDYLTMTFEESGPSTKTESLTQRKKRQAREAEERARPKSKAEIAEEGRVKREAALNQTSMDTSSKGFKMMAALGYKPGEALGSVRAGDEDSEKDTRLREPVGVEMKEGRSGIGADAEKKRKIREEWEKSADQEKRRKVDADEFRERQQQERENKKMEAQLWGAMKVAERLDDEDADADASVSAAAHAGGGKPRRSRLLSSINVLWRGLAKQRALKERDQRMRYDLHQSLSRRPTYDDADEEAEDQMALNNKTNLEEVDLELDQEDAELDEFEATDVADRLEKLVTYLREKWHYCFWCKYHYPDSSMEGCPGLNEDDHA